MSRYVFPVEAGHILMFARAIGDQNPAYVGEGGTPPTEALAPPTFPWASAQFDPDYHLRPRPGEPWFGSARGPGGRPGEGPKSGALHAEQHFEYVRSIRAGERLTVETKEGASWQKPSRRGGVLAFTERLTDYTDEAGELVCRARMIVVVQKAS